MQSKNEKEFLGAFWRDHIIKAKKTRKIPSLPLNAKGAVGTKIPPKDHFRLKKYLTENQEYTDIWSVADSFTDSSKDTERYGNHNIGVKPKLRENIFMELKGFKLKRLHKLGRRTPREMWQRLRYLSKGLTLDEWTDRMETSWENMLEYSEKLWENFFLYSFKDYKWYPYAQKYWSDSWYGQNWKNWRREEDTVTWQTNSRTPWHKHIRLSNDAESLTVVKEKIDKKFTFAQPPETQLGPNRFKLKIQRNTNMNRHERIKQGSYNSEQAELSDLNVWEDTNYIYLKYIRPWLLRLNFQDKPSFGTHKFLGQAQRRKNYEVVPEKKSLLKNFII